MNTNFTNFFNYAAKTPQNTGGGSSQFLTVEKAVWNESRTTVERRSNDGQSLRHPSVTHLSKALKYAAMLLMVFMVGIGQMWAQTFRYYIAISNADATGISSGAVRVFKTSDDVNFVNVSDQFTLNSEYSTSSAGSVYYRKDTKAYSTSSDNAIFRGPRYTKNKTFTINWSNTNLSFNKVTFKGFAGSSKDEVLTVKNSASDSGSEVKLTQGQSEVKNFECTKDFSQTNGITIVSANTENAYAITILHAVDHAEITSTATEMVTSESLQMEAWPSGGTWSIAEGGTGNGSITSAGVLTASANGTIKVKYAKDGYGEDIKTITVSDTRSIYWFAAGNTDATTNKVTNNTSFFTFTTTSTSGQSGNITIGTKTFSLTKRLGTEKDLFTFNIPANTKGTLHIVAISSGSSNRKLSIQESGDASATEIGSTTNTNSGWSLISKEDIAAGSYSVTANDNTRLGMLYMIISKTTPAPSCSTPAVPDGLAASSISSTGATFTITDDESPASYDIYYSTSSTAPVAATEASTNTTSKTKAVTGLTANTTYYAWVRAVCDASHKSDWVALGGGTFSTLPTYIVTYNTTGSDSGSAPSDATNYDSGSAVTVLGNTGSLVKSGYVFAGWNTASTLDGTDYAPGAKFNIGANTNLYPVWAEGTEETITYVVKTSSDASTTPSTHLTNLVNETNVGIAEVTDQTKSDRSGKYATSATEGYGVSFTFDVADGYTFHPTSIAIQLATVSTTDFTFYVTLEDADGTKLTSNALNTFSKDGVLTDVTFPAYDKTLAAGTVTMLVSATRAGGAAGTYRIGKTITIKGAVKALPVSGYAITKSATNGTIATSVSSTAVISASFGDQVDIVATPNTGYQFSSWSIYETATPANTISPAAATASTSFTMPAAAVTVEASFSKINYTVTHSAATNGTYTIKVGDASAVSTDATANYGQTVTLAASPNPGYGFSGWTVMQGETPVSVTNNTFTMPAGNVTISASFAQEPNVYYYKSASHYDGSAYKNPEGNAHDVALSDPWTILSGGTIAGVTSVVANGAKCDDKSTETEKWVTAYIKLESDNTAAKNVTFTIASGYLATIKMKIGAWSSTPNVYLKKSGTVQAYTGTVEGVATTENNFNEITWSDLTAGVYVLNVTSKNAYISQIDIQTTAVYTLIYDANGGTGTMENTVGTGTVTLSTNTYTKSGCTFQGWATSQANANAGTVAYADEANNYNLSADATLYAVWKLNAPTISCAANVVTMSAMSGASIYYTDDGSTTPTSESTLYNSSSKPQIAANTTFKAIAILENYVSSDVTTQECVYVAPATVEDLVTIEDDYTFEPSAEMTTNTLYEEGKIISLGGSSYNSGLQIKENRAIAFKVADNAKVKVTFNEKSDDSTPRKMQLGTATSGDAKTAYGMSGSSPVVFDVITTGGVVYLTASKDLYMTKLEILYPHTVTYALGDGTGTLPTESAHYNGEQFYVHDGVTNITAPENKEFSVWSDGTSTYAGGAQYTMGSANVTLTAQWITALPLPTITFNDGAYTIAGDALNLSSLFTSNSDGAVTYTVKTAGETGATIDGTSFTATAAGSATVTASQAATASYKAKSVDATITVSAPTEVDGVKLVEDNALTGNFRTSASLSNATHTIAGIKYTQYIGLSARTSWSSQPSGPDNYLLQYSLTKKTNKFYFYAYNTNGGNQNVKVYVKQEGENVTTTNVQVNANSGQLVSCDVNLDKNAEVCISVSSTALHICQVVVVESGADQLVAPDINYNINFNKGRLTAKSGTAKTYEGITYCNNADYKIDNSTSLKLTTRGTHYISFEIPTGQTRKLQVTTGGSAYNVSKTLGDNITTTKTGNQEFNLGAGIWYLNPQGSDVTITNLKFVASDPAITVAFNSNGGSEVASQALFAGDKVTAPTPTKDGYRLVGWQRSGVDYNFNTTLVEGDAPGFTLDAVWQKTWTVTFDSNGGSAIDAVVVDNNATVAAPDPAPEKAGHSFVEWQLSGSTYNFASPVTEDIELVAVWHELQNDPSLSALSYDGNTIDLNSGVDNEGVLTFTYELPYKGEYDAEKLSVTKAASSATLSEITYTPATKTASFTVTTADGPVVQNYAVVFTNAPKDQLCLVWAEMTDDNTLTLDENKSALDIAVQATGGVRKESTPAEYQGYTGYKFNNEGSYAELKDGNFKSGDKVDVFVVSAISDKMRVYAANKAINDNVVAISENNMVQGHNFVTLTADAASLYLRRGVKTEETYNGWNPHIAYIAVYRAYPVPVVKTITFNGAAGVIDGTTITATIPYTTNMASLPIEATFMSNDPGNTSGDVGGPWAEVSDGVYTNSYVVTDKDGDTNTYTITLTRAEVSHDASLTALAVEGYEISFDPATLSYDVQLPYGAAVGDIPAVTYTAAPGATAVKTDAAEMPGYTTIAVTAEDELTVQEYSIYFHADQIPSIVIYDGTTEMEFATESNSQLVTWTSVDAGTTIQNSGATINNKEYAHNVKVFGGQTSASRNMDIVIPADYMAKFYLAACSNSDSEADIYITKDAVGAKADAVVSVSGDRTQPAWSESDFVAPGHYFLNATNSTRLYELSVTLYSIDYTRNVTAGRLGTICLPHGGTMRGAAVYEVAYFNPDNRKIYYDEVLSGEMEPGMPYIFLPDEGNNDKLVVMYGNNVPATVAGHNNGLYGYFSNDPEESYNVPKNAGNYIISENKYWYVDDDITYVPQNRAYLRVTEMIGYNGEPAPTPAYGRRRVVMDAGAQAPQVTTGVDEINASEKPVKLMIKGQIFILRGEKMYDVTGKVVK